MTDLKEQVLAAGIRKKDYVDYLLSEMALNANDEDTFTYQEIGNRVGLSHERVRQIEQGALKKVRRKIIELARKEGMEGEL